ncbi:uncharacterized protein PG998_014351 [Apiospora kogelbergensis]|uniref:uncharacterized protein n=1 Tax=Apiospora kogelbergensis TaxID=1337665 RepID=UPI00312D73B6
MSQRRSYIAAHNVLRVLAFGANMLGYSGQGTTEELLVCSMFRQHFVLRTATLESSMPINLVPISTGSL